MVTIRRQCNHWLLFLCCVLSYAFPVHSIDMTPQAHDKNPKDTAVYQVVNEFMANVRKGNVAKVYQVYTSGDFRESTSLSQFISFVSQYPALRRNRSVALSAIRYHDNVAVVQVTLSSLEHVDDTGNFILRYDQGRWRVISIQLFPPKKS